MAAAVTRKKLATGKRRKKLKAKTRRVAKRGPGRPPEGKKIWKSVVRLHQSTADRLKKVAKQREVSINTAIESAIEILLREEGV